MKKNLFAKILMAIGALLVMGALILLCCNNYIEKKAGEKSNEVMESLTELIEDDEHKWKGSEMREEKIDGLNYVGYVSIPDLGLNLPILSKWDKATSRIAPSRVGGNAQTDDLVLAAHSYRYHFGFIGRLKSGSKIMIKDMDARTYIYEVRGVDQVYPNERERVMNSGYDLTLYTCTYSASKRIVVFCDRVK